MDALDVLTWAWTHSDAVATYMLDTMMYGVGIPVFAFMYLMVVFTMGLFVIRLGVYVSSEAHRRMCVAPDPPARLYISMQDLYKRECSHPSGGKFIELSREEQREYRKRFLEYDRQYHAAVDAYNRDYPGRIKKMKEEAEAKRKL